MGTRLATAVAFLPRFAAESESLFSLCSRAHLLSGNSRFQATTMVLLGHRRAASLHTLPVGLGHLEGASGGLIKPSLDLLRARTGLAAFLPFGSASWRANLLQKATLGAVRSGKPVVGLRWSGLSDSVYLRHCAHCLAEDLEDPGIPIWRNEHQLPCVWICPKHGVALDWSEQRLGANRWSLPGPQRSSHCAVELSGAGFAALARAADATTWIASMAKLDSFVLRAMLRSRLAQTGFGTSDLVVSAEDLVRLADTQVRVLRESGRPQFQALPLDARWIRETLNDRRASHPARWSILLSASGDCGASQLMHEYREALSRIAETRLVGRPRARRARAPDRLYEAAQHHRRMRDLAAACSMTQGEVERWLRRDAALHEAWRAANRARRRAEARIAVLTYLQTRPGAFRSEVIRACCSHARWLLVHDETWIESVLPAAWSRASRQASILSE